MVLKKTSARKNTGTPGTHTHFGMERRLGGEPHYTESKTGLPVFKRAVKKSPLIPNSRERVPGNNKNVLTPALGKSKKVPKGFVLTYGTRQWDKRKLAEK